MYCTSTSSGAVHGQVKTTATPCQTLHITLPNRRTDSCLHKQATRQSMWIDALTWRFKLHTKLTRYLPVQAMLSAHRSALEAGATKLQELDMMDGEVLSDIIDTHPPVPFVPSSPNGNGAGNCPFALGLSELLAMLTVSISVYRGWTCLWIAICTGSRECRRTILAICILMSIPSCETPLMGRSGVRLQDLVLQQSLQLHRLLEAMCKALEHAADFIW